MGEKAQYTQKGHKTLKIGIFHSHPCGFYIKNRPFAIEMAVWGLGLLLFCICPHPCAWPLFRPLVWNPWQHIPVRRHRRCCSDRRLLCGHWCQFGSKNVEKVKVLRMEFSIVENLSGLQESIFSLSRGPQLHFGEKSKKLSKFIKLTDFPAFPLFGVPWAAVILLWWIDFADMWGLCRDEGTLLRWVDFAQTGWCCCLKSRE